MAVTFVSTGIMIDSVFPFFYIKSWNGTKEVGHQALKQCLKSEKAMA